MSRHPAVLVLYDAGCGLCGALGDWLAARGIAIAPIRSAAGDLHLRDLSPEQRDATVHAVDGRGRRYSGADALPAILRAIPTLRWAAPVIEVAPAPFALGYGLVARYRRAVSRLVGLRACTGAATRTGAGESLRRASRERAG
jgi:predicted DCC family thiol-disulfide oxidoreductase YuxK